MNPVTIARRRAEREAFHAASPAMKAQLLRVHQQATLRPARLHTASATRSPDNAPSPHAKPHDP